MSIYIYCLVELQIFLATSSDAQELILGQKTCLNVSLGCQTIILPLIQCSTSILSGCVSCIYLQRKDSAKSLVAQLAPLVFPMETSRVQIPPPHCTIGLSKEKKKKKNLLRNCFRLGSHELLCHTCFVCLVVIYFLFLIIVSCIILVVCYFENSCFYIPCWQQPLLILQNIGNI